MLNLISLHATPDSVVWSIVVMVALSVLMAGGSIAYIFRMAYYEVRDD